MYLFYNIYIILLRFYLNNLLSEGKRAEFGGLNKGAPLD